jgi:hypothetical protein
LRKIRIYVRLGDEQFCPSARSQPKVRGLRTPKRRTKIFSSVCPHNALKSLDSDERMAIF